MIDKQWYRPREVAEKFGVEVRQVYGMIHDGRMAHVHIGKLLRVPASEVKRILEHAEETKSPVLNVPKRT